jgi:hypothetical protein
MDTKTEPGAETETDAEIKSGTAVSAGVVGMEVTKRVFLHHLEDLAEWLEVFLWDERPLRPQDFAMTVPPLIDTSPLIPVSAGQPTWVLAQAVAASACALVGLDLTESTSTLEQPGSPGRVGGVGPGSPGHWGMEGSRAKTRLVALALGERRELVRAVYPTVAAMNNRARGDSADDQEEEDEDEEDEI